MLDFTDEDELIRKVSELVKSKRYEEAIDLLDDSTLISIKSEDLWVLKADIYLELDRPVEALQCAREVFALNSGSSDAFYYMGWANRVLGNFEKAEKQLKKAIEIEPGNSLIQLELANTYREMKRYDKEILAFKQLVSVMPQSNYLIYRLSIALYEAGKYTEAIQNFKKYISSSNENDYYFLSAQSKIQEIDKILNSKSYDEISKIINKIKLLLLFRDDCITHYTSLSVTKKLILGKGSELRLSEGAFLNDPSEGTELYKLFDYNFLAKGYSGLTSKIDTISRPFVHKPFIGSYVAKIKENDLTLWRMYGKDNKEEAKGCAITMNCEKIRHAITRKLVATSISKENDYDLTNKRKNDTSINDEDINFYKVAYKIHNKEEFTVPGATHEEIRKLNNLFSDLIKKVDKFFEGNDIHEQKEIKELLNDIAYLIKTEEYIFENEVRLVVKGVGFTKVIDLESEPPRVYVELISINPLITQITLGPKVERAEEWSAAFHYHLANQGYSPDIHISHLPFK